MENETKDFKMNHAEENNINEDELILAPPKELFEQAKDIALKNATDEKFPFTLQYDANQKEFLLSVLQAVGAVVDAEDEEDGSLTVWANMEQLKLVKTLDCIFRVRTDEGTNTHIADEALKPAAQTKQSEQSDGETPDAQAALLAAKPEAANTAETAETTVAANTAGPSDAVDGAVAASAAAAVSTCSCPTNTDMASAQTISVESYVSGCICCPGAEQWFQFVPTQSKTYTICTTGTLDTIGFLYSCCESLVASNDDFAGKVNFRIVQYLTAGKTYYIRVRAYGNQTGSYTLRVTERIFASFVSISKDTVTLQKGVLYELPITPNYTYKGYNGARRIPGLSVSIYPLNVDNNMVWWWETSDILEVRHGWDDDGDRYIHLIASAYGTAPLRAEDWAGNGRRDECTVYVRAQYCGGENYKDVTQHSLVLQDDGHYTCSQCGYRIKSPALQDKNILSEEDYLKVLSCLTAIPYYSKLDGEDSGNYSIRATALRIIIDNIRSKSKYSQQYEYVGNDGIYKREYTVGNENDDFYMPVSIDYNVIDNFIELALNNGVASGVIELLVGWKIPNQCQYLFFDLADGYTILTDFLCGLAEKTGNKEISYILKLILFGASIEDMAVTDKIVKIQFLAGAAVYVSKIVFDSNGNLKFQEHSVS